ncbi:hypothetical protein ACA758_01325 [Mycoplasmopsis agassizii]|uniref:Uncharacterized protein n=1 Tax=Mycoplasmopsis agassizii TaxID=33922 RepID=A0ABX4H591_9BACT|nr:hypothetical protein [Mycoplasmopsis agassizii]PAF55061.1 hypothetical protein CJF60_00010 [Mycoplasmopsis agassizii]SMC19039.1 hypothetical protein SAMN02745179_00824 [Mycoplasmopsis agassizii]
MNENDEELEKTLASVRELEKIMETHDVKLVETTIRNYRWNTVEYKINATWQTDKTKKDPKDS